MDGTYGNYLPASRTMSPTVPPTSSGADRYKVNVSRQKTQKWANFKPQNYGDGWGDDDDDEWDEPEPQMPQKPMGPRQPPTVPSSSSSSFLPSQVPHRIVTAASSTGSLGSLGSLPSQSQQSLVSPGGSATSPTKPPFVRPADIYKRLEDEKRKSLEATRPNVANITGDKEVAPSEPARYTLSDSEPKASHHAGQVADVARGLNAGLATVPESRSEYGLEGPLDSYGTGEINTNIGPSRGPPFSPSAGTNSQAPNVIQHPNDSQSQPGVELRRFSSSPQLPLVTRLSGFGEDLFSPSTFQTDSTQQPIIQTGSPTGIAQNPSLGPLAKAEPGSDKQISLRVSGDLSKSDAGPSATDTTIRSRSPPNEPEQSIGSQDGSTAAQPLGNWPTQQQQRAVDPPREPASNTGMDDKALPNRPSLPGSWVTETPSTPGNALIAAKTEPAREASPVNQIDAATVSTPDADRSRQPSPARVGEASETTSVKQEAASLPSTLPPPLRTSSPTTNTKSDMLRDYKSWERGVSPEKTGTATKSNPAPSFGLAQNRDITPIAPLNTRRDAPEVSTDVQPVLSPPSNGTEPSLETDAISPLKENDMLSQEILESLSPVQSSENFVPINGATTSAYQAAAEQSAEDPGRESSYLGDVYDDYWAAGEEKDSQAVVESKEVREHNDSPPPVHSAAASTTTPPLNPTQISIAANVVPIPSNEKTPTAPATTASAAEDSRRRFSWEAAFSDPEPVVTQLTATPPLSEPKSLGSGLSHAGSTPNVDGSAPSLVSSAGVKSDAPPAPGAMSHQVSQASPLAARSASDPAEPPSPISIVSEQQGKRSSPAPEAQRKLSVADPFKGASPAALLPEDEMTPKASVPRAPSPKTPLNILPFRHIMEMGSSTERIQQFDEARLQFAAIDTGLEEWLASMVSKHPEHSTGGFGASREALHLPTGQPAHFQQAGHVNSAGIQANIPMPPLQQHGTAFGHLHGSNQVNQVGTKSKELLMAAGKAGKGLFSKGRNKLRGTGDKVFST